MDGTSTIEEQDSRPSLVAFGNNVQKLSCTSKVAVRSALLASTRHADYNSDIQRKADSDLPNGYGSPRITI
jgi:hypothetical protein